MTTSFLHGVETIEVNDGVRPVQLAPSGTIGLVGTAPLADPTLFPLNTPVLLTSQPRAALALGATGTLLQAIKQIYAQYGACVVVVRVAQSTLSDPTAAAAATLANVVGNEIARTGCYALLTARAETGVVPKTLIAPGFTSVRPGGAENPVVGALAAIALRLRGRVYADLPPVYADALTYRADWDDDRIVGFYPSVAIWDDVSGAYIDAPQSASEAGLTAMVHNTLGFWYSPSNQVFQGGDGGVGGVATPIDFGMDDANCLANILNESQITTVINGGLDYSGWRRWGNRNFSTDPLWQFESVRTSLDEVYEAVQKAEAYAVDKPPSVQIMKEMAQMVQAFFDYGKVAGFLIGGKVWLDPERNTPQQTSQGIWAWDFDPEPPAPMEHIQNYAHRNTNYYTDLVAAIVATLNTSSTTASSA